MTSYRYLGYGVTDSNGVAHLDHDPSGNPINGYTGTGAGEVDVIASTDNPITGSSIVSGTYPVLDCVSYNPCTSEVSNYFAFTRCTGSYSDNGMQVTANSTTGTTILVFKILNTVMSTSNKYAIEFDLKTANEIVFRTDISSNTNIASITGSFDIFNTMRLEYDFPNNLITYYKNGEYVSSKSIDNYESTKVVFYIGDFQQDMDIVIKDVKVYPI